MHYTWKVQAVDKSTQLSEMAESMEKRLNALEEEGFEIFDVMESSDRRPGLLLVGRRPRARGFANAPPRRPFRG